MSIIDVYVGVDTVRLLRDHKPVGLNQEEPTFIHNAKGYVFMITSDDDSGDRPQAQYQGGPNLEIFAYPGDLVRFHARSASNNFSNPVLIYGLSKPNKPKETPDIFSINGSRVIVQDTVEPLEGLKVLPPTKKSNQEFWFYEAEVKHHGKEYYTLKFGIFDGPGSITSAQGYYYWDPVITVRHKN